MEMEEKKTNDAWNSEKDEMEKRRPKPYRYITDISELPNDEDIKMSTVMSVKSDVTVKKLMEQFDSVIGLGDVNAIERVVQKHEKRHKKHDPSIE
jgi:hypothetical protein